MRVDVVVVSEVRLYRESLAELLGSASRVRVVGTACVEDVARIRKLPAEVALVCSDLGRTAELAALVPDVKVVVFMGCEVVDELVGGVEAGIAGFMPQESSLDELVETIERVARGEFLCPLELAGALADRLASRSNGAAGQRPELTPCELEILKLMAAGLANKQIARQLGRRVPTVKNHVHNILAKLEASSRTEAVARANGGERSST